MRRISPAALAAFVVPFAIYVVSLPRGVAEWDIAEMQTVPYILGISHPTGFPTFVFTGWFISHVLPLGSVAWRLNLMSAAAMALAAYFVYRTVVELEGKRSLGALCAILFAVGDIAWTRGSRTEVHTFAILFEAITIYLVLRWRRTGEERALLGAALAYGCALATHGIVVLIAPGIALLLFPQILRVPRTTLFHAAGHVVLPSLLYLYLPIRSNYIFAHGLDPTVTILGLEPGRPFWDFGHPATPAALWHYLTGGDSSPVGAGFASMFNPLLYPQVVAKFGASAAHEFGVIALVFAVLGVAMLVRTQWYTALGLVVVGLPSIPYGLLYLEADPERYMLTAYWLIALFVAIGISRTLQLYLQRNGILVDAIGIAIALGLAAGIFSANVQNFGQRNDTSPTDYVDKVIARTPSNAILVANWAYATPLGYAAYVERRLDDRIVVTAFSGQFSSYYPKWIKMRPLYMVNQNYDGKDFRVQAISTDPLLVQLIPK
jgi:hypothetical protein